MKLKPWSSRPSSGTKRSSASYRVWADRRKRCHLSSVEGRRTDCQEPFATRERTTATVAKPSSVPFRALTHVVGKRLCLLTRRSTNDLKFSPHFGKYLVDIRSRTDVGVGHDQQGQWMDMQHSRELFHLAQRWTLKSSLKSADVGPTRQLAECLLRQPLRDASSSQRVGKGGLLRSHGRP